MLQVFRTTDDFVNATPIDNIRDNMTTCNAFVNTVCLYDIFDNI